MALYLDYILESWPFETGCGMGTFTSSSMASSTSARVKTSASTSMGLSAGTSMGSSAGANMGISTSSGFGVYKLERQEECIQHGYGCLQSRHLQCGTKLPIEIHNVQ